MPNDQVRGRVLVSYLTLRRVVGVLGVALPIILATWGFSLFQSFEIRTSISDYYSDRTRDAFVGVLFVIAWFLYTYRGYDKLDDVAGNFACVFALGVALFPNSAPGWQPIAHYVSAAGLFVVLAYFSFFLFTKTGGRITPQKRVRNKIYRTCGIIIPACIALIGIYSWRFDETAIAKLKPVFWLESVALWAFGISWFVKGETLWKDAARETTRELVIYVDVDDTLVRSVSHKRIPIPKVVEHVRALADSGAVLYCWSSGGANYARKSAEELGIAGCFSGFLPKPQVFLDDQSPEAWRGSVHVHPQSVCAKTIEDYLRELKDDVAGRS